MRAVIFDFDGVLVDSEPLHYRALKDALQPEGIAVSQDEYVQVYLAYDDRECIRVALERHGQAYDPARVEAIALRKGRLFDEHLAGVPFFAGARELVTTLAAEVPLAIASGALHAEIEAILVAGELRTPFAAVVAADDVERTKPDPMPYLEAARRLRALVADLEPNECVAIEDSPAGIASARAAGMFVVGVAHSYPAAKLRGLAHHVAQSLDELSVAGLRAMARRA